MMSGRFAGGGHWMPWVFGGLLILGFLVLVGVIAWAVVTATTRAHPSRPGTDPAAESGASGRSRQILDERYARGELTTDEYTERLHTLAL